jgi:HSP20 family molecular chaperone IbpA
MANQQAATDQPSAAGQQQAMTGQQAAAAPARAERAGGELPTFVPPTDIYEAKDSVTMLLDMPGADPNSLDVTLDKRVLTVSARSTPTIPQGYALVHAEYRDGNYERAFTLSDQIDADQAQAAFRDGVLRLTLPKTSPAPAKKIPVRAE